MALGLRKRVGRAAAARSQTKLRPRLLPPTVVAGHEALRAVNDNRLEGFAGNLSGKISIVTIDSRIFRR